MPNVSRIWNGRLPGLPSALILGFAAAVGRIGDRLSTLLWRGNLKRLGPGAIVQSGVTIRYPGRISLNKGAFISRGAELTSEMRDASCVIGCQSQVGRQVRLDFTGGLDIGDRTVLSERVAVFTHSHGTDPMSVPTKAPLRIGSGVWIGAGATIVEGASSIGDGAVVAAGAVVTKPVPARVLVAGVPARVIRTLE